jgi:hypothetical protein
LTRTFYEASADEKEGQRRRHGHRNNTEDGAEPQGDTEASALDDAAVDVR